MTIEIILGLPHLANGPILQRAVALQAPADHFGWMKQPATVAATLATTGLPNEPADKR